MKPRVRHISLFFCEKWVTRKLVVALGKMWKGQAFAMSLLTDPTSRENERDVGHPVIGLRTKAQFEAAGGGVAGAEACGPAAPFGLLFG